MKQAINTKTNGTNQNAPFKVILKPCLFKEAKGKVIMPPTEWYTMDPEKYANTYMEHGSSFHVAPPYYRRNDWGVSPLAA